MLSLNTLGSLDLRSSDGSEVHSVLTQPKRTALLVYLTLASPRGLHRRDRLVSLFWPEVEQARARKALSQALNFLRHELPEAVIATRGAEDVGVHPDAITADAVSFESALDAQRFQDALDLYQGDFLIGFHAGDAWGFDEWASGERERLKKRAADGAWALARDQLGRGAVADSERSAQRALRHHLSDESAVRSFIQALAAAGDRAAAVRFYERFAEALEVDLDLRPHSETRALVEDIRTSMELVVNPPESAHPPVGEDPRTTSVPNRLQATLTDRYLIEREIGRGGMATVYLASDLRHQRKVAMKVLDPELAVTVGAGRFLREIETAANLTHPHILPLHDSGEADGLLYYVMPYVKGGSLRERLDRERQLPVDEAVRITREIADALNHAHERELLHRDVKPANILLEAGHAVLADFGVAKAVADADRTRLTRTGSSFGTPAYMSPEQASGEQELDGRSDQYALGCVLYEMLVGEPPVTDSSARRLVSRKLLGEFPALRDMSPAVPPEVDRAVARALAPDPADRFANAREFAEALGATAAAGQRTGPNRRWLPWLATVAMAIMITAAWYVRAGRSNSGSAEGAEVERAWMLPADFVGNADEEIRRIVQELVIVEVDRSPSVVVLTAPEVARGLRAAGRADTVTVVPEIALELAELGGIGAVLAGEVDRVGNTFSIRVRVLDVGQEGRLIAAATSSAEGEDRLIPAAGDAARELRSHLGERVADVAGTPPLEFVMTPSLPAYRKYREARQPRPLSDRERIDLYHQALQLDTGFAAALLEIPNFYANIGEFDSAMVYLQRALERSDRLTEAQRLAVRAGQASVRGDIPEAYRLQRELFERHGIGYTNLGVYLIRLGRLEDAAEYYSLPRGPTPQPMGNAIVNLIRLERLEEADSLLRHYPDANIELSLLVSRHRWDDALADAIERARDVTLAPNDRRFALRIQASVLAARGSVGASRQALRDALRLTQGYGDQRVIEGNRLVLALASETTVAPLASTLSADSSTAGLLFRGVAAAVRGDSATARELLQRVRQRPPEAYAPYDAAFPMAEAGIAWNLEDWARVPELVADAATGFWPYLPRGSLDNPGLIQWMVGDALERMSQPDSAVTYFEMLTTPRFVYPQRLGYAYGFAHRRLARLYTRLGDDKLAIEHWLTFLDTFTEPDLEFERMVEEARAELARLGG